MSILQSVITAVENLPTEKQQEVLDFAEFLYEKSPKKKSFKHSLGACADLNISISGDEIDEARREMWTNFPREQFFESEETK